MTRLAYVLPALLTCGFAQAQFEGPAKQVERFDRLVGTWNGSGTVVMQPGTPAASWTMTTQYTKALGGHFVREDTTIEIITPEAPVNLQFTGFFGWDPQNKRYVNVAVTSMGEAKTEQIHWADADTMVTYGNGIEDGKSYTDRWITKLSDNEIAFIGHRAIADGEFFTHVKGKLTRAQIAAAAAEGEAAADATAVRTRTDAGAYPPAPQEMKRIAKMAGNYHMKGFYMMGPGQPKMDIGATELVRPIYGGTILEMVAKGDPVEGMPFVYEGWSAIAWNPAEKRYRQIYVNNMGHVGASDGWFVTDSEMVFTSALIESGSPVVNRMHMKLGADGALKKATNDAIHGTHAPAATFGGEYERK